MPLPKKPPVKKPLPPTPPSFIKQPFNFLRNSKTKGNYIGWLTDKKSREPDFGKGNAGPGIPYREVEQKLPTYPKMGQLDAKSAAIRRRMNNG